MRKLITLLLLLPLYTLAQNCTLQKTKDQFTQQPKLTSGFVPLNNARFSLDADNKEIDLFLTLNTGRCFDDASTAVIQFEGKNVKSNFRNGGTMNCEGLFHITFRNTPTPPSALQRLATQKVKSITLTANDKNTAVIELTPEQQQLLQTMAGCMVAEAKTLIQ